MAQEIPAAAFYRSKFEGPSDDHYEFQGGQPHQKIFKSLILARFDPEGARDQVRFYLRMMNENQKRARKFFIKHHKRN